MKIKRRLISFPVIVICLIAVLVGIVSWNNYLNSKQQRMALMQLTSSAVLLKQFQIDASGGVSRVIAENLKELKLFEENAKKLNQFGQFASIFVLVGALLLSGIFLYNLSDIVKKLNSLSMEVKQINQNSLDECDLHHNFGDSDNEIDGLASNLEHVIRDFKKSIREKNGQLIMLKKSNTELKERLEKA